MKTEYEIGGRVYTRKELLEFGKRHYPKFYWIKRGIGIGLMASFGLPALICLFAGFYLQQFVDSSDKWQELVPATYFWSAGICAIGLLAGIILFAISFNPLPDESYIKHAVDYYTKQANNNARQEVRQATRQEREDANTLARYKRLYDAGAISQEEYEAKKNELLK